MIIGLSGYANSGKDEIARIILKLDNSFTVKKFASKVKEIASMLTGYPVEMFEDRLFKSQPLGDEWSKIKGRDTIKLTARDLLQKIGTEAIRNNLHEDAWINALFLEYCHPYPNWVITDCRFPNEAAAIKKRGGYMIRVDRKDNYPANEHDSETALDIWEFDYIINNNGGLEQLQDEVKKVFERL